MENWLTTNLFNLPSTLVDTKNWECIFGVTLWKLWHWRNISIFQDRGMDAFDKVKGDQHILLSGGDEDLTTQRNAPSELSCCHTLAQNSGIDDSDRPTPRWPPNRPYSVWGRDRYSDRRSSGKISVSRLQLRRCSRGCNRSCVGQAEELQRSGDVELATTVDVISRDVFGRSHEESRKILELQKEMRGSVSVAIMNVVHYRCSQCCCFDGVVGIPDFNNFFFATAA
ncbi:cytochrome P450 [Striga asiatica]|uniref:Cytochrome P450 n=1 Tax=Striga asiatica TaxID=4170 RepID=A0A5A7R3Z0_STRAF|nr:cytochrome P450 [Striga asiatica]